MNEKKHVIQIERVPVNEGSPMHEHFFEEFVRALAKIPVGSSFLVPKIPSHFRIAISVMHIAMGRRFRVRKEGNQHRVGRVL